MTQQAVLSPDFSQVAWRKSSRSNGDGGECVEVGALDAAAWRKSSRSNGNGGECVELADLVCHVAVRDSKRPAQPALAFARTEWTTFARTTRVGRFDLS